MSNEHEPYENVKAWCIYCKDPIFENDPIVVDGDKEYHPDCFNLIKRDNEEYGYNDEE